MVSRHNMSANNRVAGDCDGFKTTVLESLSYLNHAVTTRIKSFLVVSLPSGPDLATYHDLALVDIHMLLTVGVELTDSACYELRQLPHLMRACYITN